MPKIIRLIWKQRNEVTKSRRDIRSVLVPIKNVGVDSPYTYSALKFNHKYRNKVILIFQEDMSFISSIFLSTIMSLEHGLGKQFYVATSLILS